MAWIPKGYCYYYYFLFKKVVMSISIIASGNISIMAILAVAVSLREENNLSHGNIIANQLQYNKNNINLKPKGLFVCYDYYKTSYCITANHLIKCFNFKPSR